jgi:hypothetical protein
VEDVDLLCSSKTPLFGGSLQRASQSQTKKNGCNDAGVDLDPVRGLLTANGSALLSCVTEIASLTMVSLPLLYPWHSAGRPICRTQSMLDTDDQLGGKTSRKDEIRCGQSFRGINSRGSHCPSPSLKARLRVARVIPRSDRPSILF